MAQAQTTTDHDRIRKWAEDRGGHPATVKATETDDEPGILRLDFEPLDDALEEISWDEFFDKFDESELAFLFQEKTAQGKMSRFHKFVSRDTVEDLDEEEEDAEEDDTEDEE